MKRKYGVTLAASVWVFIFLIPLLGAIYTSLRTDNAISSGPFVWQFDSTFSHFKNAMGAAGYDFASFFKNSIIISTGTVLLTIFISFPASYSIVRLGFGGPWLLRLALALRITPAIFFVIPFYKLFTAYNLIDKPIVLILADSFINMTLAILVFSGAINEMPLEIEEAAAVDGASVWMTLRKIVFPLLGPGMAAVAVLTFLF